MSQPDVSICIVNRDGGPLLLELLQALPPACGQLTTETIIVDNASRDGGPDSVAASHPEVLLLRNPENAGFARGNNQAAAAAQGRTLLFLNNDTLPRPGSVERLVRYLQAQPTISAVGPRLVGRDGQPQASCGPLPSFRALLHRIRFLHWTGAFRLAYQRYRHPELPTDSGPVSRLGGAALLVSHHTWKEIPWDEGYPFGLEDVDLSVRLARHGPLHYVLEAEVVHYGGVSSRAYHSFTYRGFELGYARFLAQHDRRLGALLLYKTLVTLDQPLRFMRELARTAKDLLRGRGEAAGQGLRRSGAVLSFLLLGLPLLWLGDWRATAARTGEGIQSKGRINTKGRREGDGT